MTKNRNQQEPTVALSITEATVRNGQGLRGSERSGPTNDMDSRCSCTRNRFLPCSHGAAQPSMFSLDAIIRWLGPPCSCILAWPMKRIDGAQQPRSSESKRNSNMTCAKNLEKMTNLYYVPTLNPPVVNCGL